jgi:hypothetical protein
MEEKDNVSPNGAISEGGEAEERKNGATGK